MALGLALVVLAGMVGASIASFLTVVGERRRRSEPINGRSHCTCGRQLAWWENVPIVSYLALRGRARCCGTAIPAHYLWNELAGACIAAGLVALLIAAVSPPS